MNGFDSPSSQLIDDKISVLVVLLALILIRNLKMLVSFFSPDKPLSAKSRLPTAAVEEAC